MECALFKECVYVCQGLHINTKQLQNSSKRSSFPANRSSLCRRTDLREEVQYRKLLSPPSPCRNPTTPSSLPFCKNPTTHSSRCLIPSSSQVSELFKEDPTFVWLHQHEALQSFEAWQKENGEQIFAAAKGKKYRVERDARRNFMQWLEERTPQTQAEYADVLKWLDR